MKRNAGIAGCLVCVFFLFSACGVEEVDDDTSPTSSTLPKSGKATLRILLHDKPTAKADEVWVKFDKVTANHETEGWLTVSDKVKAVDLLKLQNGVVEEIGLAELPAGKYDEVRLHLVDAWVVVNGAQEPLKVPSGMQSGLKIETTLTMPECGTVTMTLDWDAGAHLVKNKGQGWILRPVIVVESVSACTKTT